MGVYNEMLDAGLIEERTFYSGSRINPFGKECPALLVDVKFKNTIITLVSEFEYSDDLKQLARSLERTFLHSVKIQSIQKTSTIAKSSLFSDESSQQLTEEYLARENLIYTPDGLYVVDKSWADNRELLLQASGLSTNTRVYGMKDEYRQELESLGARKIVDFSEFSNPVLKASTYNLLLAKGATEVEKLSYHQDRAKAFGHMYEGKACLELDGASYYHYMWYHHSSETYMTEEEASNNIGLRSLKITPEKFQKLFPHNTVPSGDTRMSATDILRLGNSIYVYPECPKDLNQVRGDLIAKLEIYGLTKSLESELLDLGFAKLI